MNPRTDKLVRATTMVSTVTVAYFLITADYGSEPNVLDPELSRLNVAQVNMTQIKKAILSAERSVKEFVFGPDK